ncbi:hypothetical protein BRD00_14810 [Halobacteriales archaeon QS_8_69_26]|nr:MAG: hypothetical protein BRD00_14810 [Halobacteriales archaeon QS_8_69_26]
MRFDRESVYRRVPRARTLRVGGGLALGVGVAPVVVGGVGLLAGLFLGPDAVTLLGWGIRLVAVVAGLGVLVPAFRTGSGTSRPPAVVVLGSVLVGIGIGSLVVAALLVPLRAFLDVAFPPGLGVDAGTLELFAIGIHLLAATLGATTLHAIGLFYRGSWARTGGSGEE